VLISAICLAGIALGLALIIGGLGDPAGDNGRSAYPGTTPQDLQNVFDEGLLGDAGASDTEQAEIDPQDEAQRRFEEMMIKFYGEEYLRNFNKYSVFADQIRFLLNFRWLGIAPDHPDYLGGWYFSEEGKLVVLFVEGVDMPENDNSRDIMAIITENDIEVRFVKYSYTELYRIRDIMISVPLSKYVSSSVVDISNNHVIITLFDEFDTEETEAYITEFMSGRLADIFGSGRSITHGDFCTNEAIVFVSEITPELLV
jgi:hypothetical protein